ncbi:putative cytoplasmic protein [Salmonella enterica subsp. arizonae]|uniref:Putative cytoplasmic protein n=1 Tax=Salmonella enterica subsp. arizonae TaxID=59203 RepID=A0A379SXI6_SALER|nr:putative cytoplasmic protein [Salmonella enterica subsp. arizonae]
MSDIPFWQRKTLDEMTDAEWGVAVRWLRPVLSA